MSLAQNGTSPQRITSKLRSPLLVSSGVRRPDRRVPRSGPAGLQRLPDSGGAVDRRAFPAAEPKKARGTLRDRLLSPAEMPRIEQYRQQVIDLPKGGTGNPAPVNNYQVICRDHERVLT